MDGEEADGVPRCLRGMLETRHKDDEKKRQTALLINLARLGLSHRTASIDRLRGLLALLVGLEHLPSSGLIEFPDRSRIQIEQGASAPRIQSIEIPNRESDLAVRQTAKTKPGRAAQHSLLLPAIAYFPSNGSRSKRQHN